jgi:hypothetical protein
MLSNSFPQRLEPEPYDRLEPELYDRLGIFENFQVQAQKNNIC